MDKTFTFRRGQRPSFDLTPAEAGILVAVALSHPHYISRTEAMHGKDSAILKGLVKANGSLHSVTPMHVLYARLVGRKAYRTQHYLDRDVAMALSNGMIKLGQTDYTAAAMLPIMQYNGDTTRPIYSAGVVKAALSLLDNDTTYDNHALRNLSDAMAEARDFVLPFGAEPIELERIRTTVRLKPATLSQIEALAHNWNVTVSAYIEQIVVDSLSENE